MNVKNGVSSRRISQNTRTRAADTAVQVHTLVQPLLHVLLQVQSAKCKVQSAKCKVVCRTASGTGPQVSQNLVKRRECLSSGMSSDKVNGSHSTTLYDSVCRNVSSGGNVLNEDVFV
jgi:hypothetical protein